MTPAGKRIALMTFGVLALAAAGGYTATHLALKHGVQLNTYGNEVGGSFRLMDSTTGTMTDQTFRNRWMLVLFGATHCAEDACAPALRNMSAALDQVEGGRHNAVIIFVSLDPDRDDAERLRQYGESIGPRVVSGTAAPFALADLAKEYHAPIEKVPDPEWTYTMRMSPQFVVMGPEVRYKGMVDARADSAHMAEDLRRIMQPQNGG
ncbi:electron transport transmembrane protein Sco1/SenC/PrrC [Acetobacter pasteurianus subsp. pasteurianus LMG 1262 = NBRC 106471]|uniref:Protein SCO1 like protein 1, mitochondrial n=1 Tax=Acetobacter pasteurianus TaxID=438 RepID=A0A1A0CXB1_ACEPA|nr:SCO family protein [Acetobacter pasteurianus]OAZ67186.1 Protein SCO1 like protein 1, mitochondrial [Acetobacter pasteurianus]GAB30536.1 electron transport transmembrane protein Sco1/SenC/PrrC [Acetobacter pasteurianus subsp. pasteurianus LMG 1262 = NBRC 106471]GCD50453.1 electron transport protein SCO1/SenC [Acetobacter pasteurianus subsp. pasteurianus LMG 1262 = NBRC 106471]GCD56659.1 electron transport protein SCO1/SenC [Acetobacter pasteurianus NBRC 3222]